MHWYCLHGTGGEVSRTGVRTLGLYSQPWRVPPASASAVAGPVSASLSFYKGKIKLACFAKTMLALMAKKSYRN